MVCKLGKNEFTLSRELVTLQWLLCVPPPLVLLYAESCLYIVNVFAAFLRINSYFFERRRVNCFCDGDLVCANCGVHCSSDEGLALTGR